MTELSGMHNLEIALCFSEVNRTLLARNNILIRLIEWGLPTQFQATDSFLRQWADAQKLAYSKGKGWIVSCFLAD